MRYHCVSCDEDFEPEDEDKPRCPSCLRVHSLEAGEETPPERSRPAWVVPTLVMAVLAAAASAYVLLGPDAERKLPERVPARPLTDDELDHYLKRHQVPAGALAKLLAATPEIRQFANQAAAGGGNALDRAKRIVDAVQLAKKQRAFVRWPLVDPRPSAPMTAESTLGVLQKAGARKRLYPLEIASLATAALRSLGVHAMLAEVYAFPNDKAPPEPSGRLGYFAVAVYDEPNAKPVVVDPYAGRNASPDGDAYDVRTDVEAVGVALGLGALSRLIHDQAPASALTASEHAVRLTPRSPATRSVRAAVLLASGGEEVAAKELAAALQLRSDPPRRHNQAAVALAKGELKLAMRQLSAALEQAPEYASAHATLAGLHLTRGEADEARAALAEAERLEPKLPGLPLLWAQYYLRAGKTDQAIAQAQRAADQRGHDPQVRLVLGSIYRQAGRYEQMRTEAQKAIELSPASRRDDMRQLVRQILGPTALDASDDLSETDPDETELAGGTPSRLQLGTDSLLLSDGEPGEVSGSRSKTPKLVEENLRLRGPSPHAERGGFKLELSDP